MIDYKKVVYASLLLTCFVLHTYWKHHVELESKNEIEPITTKHPSYKERLLEVDGLCYDLQVFLMKTERSVVQKALVVKRVERKPQVITWKKKHGVNEATLIGVMLALLVVSIIAAFADALKVKREEKSNQSPDSDVRCSLAEFANMKRPRRESSFGDNSRRGSIIAGGGISGVAQLCRFESVGSAFSRMRRESLVPPQALPGTETPTTPTTATSVIRAPLKLLGMYNNLINNAFINFIRKFYQCHS